MRFIVSLRACGEGHISSIEFRTGIVDARRLGDVRATSARFALTARPDDDALYDKAAYVPKLVEMKAHRQWAEPVLALLDDEFTMSDLKYAIERCRPPGSDTSFTELADNMLWLAHSNYQLEFSPDIPLSERVIFPVSENESRGIEDARFVRFTHANGRVAYFATYTAYNGFRVLPQLIETTDFRHFKINTLNGRCVQNKGMALFPRKIGDDFVMASRLDGENIYLLRSDNVHFWNESTLVREPKYPWEFVQVGNCGSPIETKAGWLLLTHGVGPMRQYWIGALLLDLEDPSRVIGELREPLLMPNADERDGYVPNVVYSCGAMRPRRAARHSLRNLRQLQQRRHRSAEGPPRGADAGLIPTRRPRSLSPRPRQFTPGCRRASPRPRQFTPGCRRASPRPRQFTPGCRRASPRPRQFTPGCRRASPRPRQFTPGCRRASPRPRQFTPGPPGASPGPPGPTRAASGTNPAARHVVA